MSPANALLGRCLQPLEGCAHGYLSAMSLLLGLLEKPQAEVKGEDQILSILAPEKLRVSSPELKGVVATIPLLGVGGT